MKPQIRKINIDGRDYDYIFTQKNVKGIRVWIREDKIIRISAPYGFSRKEAEEIILKDKNFIIKAIGDYEDKEMAEKSQTEYVYLGRKIPVEIIESEKNSCTYDSEKESLLITVNDGRRKLYELEDITDKWLLEKAKTFYEIINSEVYSFFNSHGYEVPLSKITIRKMKSRWGSCSYESARISMNLNLMHYEYGCILSVFFHEYMHYIHHDHSKEFYRDLYELFPDYEKYHDMLKK